MKHSPLPPTQVNDQGSIPVLCGGDPAHQPLYQSALHALASARQVTVLCGAGISTSAGIPDFRSPEGLYNGARPELPARMNASELFDEETLRDAERLRAFNRFMARLRMTARSAEPTICHAVIAKLFDKGRLRRLYTQNIDGLQTRERNDMSHVVLELHGSNARLLCHKCGKQSTEDPLSLDNHLMEHGEARCSGCRRNDSGTGWEARLRRLSPGYMLPAIVYNHDSREHELEGMSLDEMEEADGRADLLLIVGTSITTQGVARLVKSLAKKVHQYGGAVVYIDRGKLSKSKWAGFVDLQLAVDIETWAKDLFKLLDSVVPSDGTGEKVAALAKTLCERGDDAPSGSNPNLHRLTSKDDRIYGLKTFPASGCGDRPVEPGRLMFLACHSGSSSSLASALATHVALACDEKGWECRSYAVVLSGSEQLSMELPEWDSYELVALHVSDYVSLLPYPRRGTEQDCSITKASTFPNRA
ncbi:hypothetical protein FRC08_011026 [Ceratobasidium sp. 394]|nr:hypothetical protein FRC08_011026 [Ceratobasidium sp. 394]